MKTLRVFSHCRFRRRRQCRTVEVSPAITVQVSAFAQCHLNAHVFRGTLHFHFHFPAGSVLTIAPLAHRRTFLFWASAS